MNKNDLDIAIEKCERIMEFDTRTLKNPESENGWIFEKVYDLLKFLRRIKSETRTRDNANDSISKQEAIDALNRCKEIYFYNLPPAIFKTDAVDAVRALTPAQPDIPDMNIVIDAIENAINASTGNEAYMVGLRNGMRWCWSALTDKEPEFEEIPPATSYNEGEEHE